MNDFFQIKLTTGMHKNLRASDVASTEELDASSFRITMKDGTTINGVFDQECCESHDEMLAYLRGDWSPVPPLTPEQVITGGGS